MNPIKCDCERTLNLSLFPYEKDINICTRSAWNIVDFRVRKTGKIHSLFMCDKHLLAFEIDWRFDIVKRYIITKVNLK